MAQAKLADGWLMVPYDGPELTTIELGDGTAWYPAFLDWDATGTRVAQIRPPDGSWAARQLTVRVAGQVYALHTAALAAVPPPAEGGQSWAVAG